MANKLILTEAQIKQVRIRDLFFDSENPRLPNSVNGKKENAVIKWMLEDASLLELMSSIAQQDFFQGEPLLVVKSNKGYTVIEGNRRLAAVKLLNNISLALTRKNTVREIVREANYRPTVLPVVVFPKKEAIIKYLGFRHITGVKSWSALAKARYLAQLMSLYPRVKLKDKYKILAKIIGSNAPHVKLLLTGLKVYNSISDKSFFRIKNLDEESISFGVLYTAISYRNIAKFLDIDLSQPKPIRIIVTVKLKEFTKWIFEKNSQNKTRVGDSRNLDVLDKILGNKRALEAFRKGKSLDEASLFTDFPSTVYTNLLQKALSYMQSANDYIRNVKTASYIDFEALNDIQSISKDLIILTQKRLTDAD